MIPTAFSPYDNIFLQVSQVKMKILRCYDRKNQVDLTNRCGALPVFRKQWCSDYIRSVGHNVHYKHGHISE